VDALFLDVSQCFPFFKLYRAVLKFGWYGNANDDARQSDVLLIQVLESICKYFLRDLQVV